ncbi:transcriptional regulator, TetR family [Sphingomonas guangdongensis]|uniref:Transcriptional regulator, TetR family n=1 Tax=Sphingomonas guangdongensis TaxID=1141890 RepID=A0A285QDX6_9SPHN|nr:TetR/AcrR family transcriptional regulator [Sphingomonas guangdongensis]SOB80046.1 transcriptional regulator, TetR family [Sphingomonas guangdongensis]
METGTKTRGRPRDPAKREAMLDAARTLFLRQGVDAVTVDHVTAAARVSRDTYYNNFENRDALLAAVIARESERIAGDAFLDDDHAEGVREALIRYGERFLRFLADPDAMGWEPMILHLHRHRPDLARSFFDIGPRRAWRALEQIITAGQRRGDLSPIDPAQAVNDLIGLWQGSWRVELVYGCRAPLDEGEVQRRARQGVDVFLGAVGTKGG